MKAGDKIYYIDYEKTGESYTILKTIVINDDDMIPDGTYYMVTKDNSGNLKPFPIKTSHVDSAKWKYYSSAEKAHEALVEYRKLLKHYQIKSNY